MKFGFLKVSVAIDTLMVFFQMETVARSFSPGGNGQGRLICATKPVPEAVGTKVTPGTLTWVLQLALQLGIKPVCIAVVLLRQRLKAYSWKNKFPSKAGNIVGWLQELSQKSVSQRRKKIYTSTRESFERTQTVYPDTSGCDICELSD